MEFPAAPLLLTALLAAASVSHPGLGQAPATGDADVLVVDASTGELASPPAQAGATVTVRVDGVERSASGFDLHGPDGPAFLNQSSRHDGTVAFWDVPVAPGTYRVERSHEGDSRTLVDGLALMDAPAATDGSGCVSTYYGSYDCSRNCQGASGQKKVDEALRWTPILLVNSPSGGEASASNAWGRTESVYVAPGGRESRTTSGDKITAENGASRGLFRLAKWGFYRQTHSTCAAGYPSQTTARVIDWSPGGTTRETTEDLTGDSRYTDADNLRRIEVDGTPSLAFDIRYHSMDRDRRGPSEHTVSEREIVSFGGSISTASHFVSFETIEFRVTASDESRSYTYEFGNSRWAIDEIDGSPGWAFCRPLVEDC